MDFGEIKESQWEKADEAEYAEADERVFRYMESLFGREWRREHKTVKIAYESIPNGEVA